MVTIQPQQLAPTMVWIGRARNCRFPSLQTVLHHLCASREQHTCKLSFFWVPRWRFWEH